MIMNNLRSRYKSIKINFSKKPKSNDTPKKRYRASRRSIDSIEEALSNGIYRIRFHKVNGEIRSMLCTRDFNYVSKSSQNYSPPKGVRGVPSHIVVVWDLEKDDWRCFRKWSLISMKLVKKL